MAGSKYHISKTRQIENALRGSAHNLGFHMHLTITIDKMDFRVCGVLLVEFCVFLF
jgi:hypothetical protein